MIMTGAARPAGTAVGERAFSEDRPRARATSLTPRLVHEVGTVRNLPADEAPARYRRATTDELTSREEAP